MMMVKKEGLHTLASLGGKQEGLDVELGCKWVQAPDGFLWHRLGPDWRILSQTHIKVELPGLLACQTPTNPQLSYLAKRLLE